MISLEQIKQLETRVHSAVARIRSLTAENTTLKESLADYEKRITELEELISGFKSEQQEIEAGIVAALSQLDGLEDAVAEPAVETTKEPSDPSGTTESAEPSVTVETTLPPRSEPETAHSNDDSEPIEEPVAEPEITEDAAPEAAENASSEIEITESDEEEPELDIF